MNKLTTIKIAYFEFTELLCVGPPIIWEGLPENIWPKAHWYCDPMILKQTKISVLPIMEKFGYVVAIFHLLCWRLDIPDAI